MVLLKSWINRFYRLKINLKKILGVNRIENAINYLEQKIIYGYIKDLDSRISILENSKKSFIQPTANDQKNISLDNPISQPSTHSQFLEPIYLEWCNRIKAERRFHRKQWEYIYILRCFEVNQVIKPGKKGIGFGVGAEPIAPYLASLSINTLATDLHVDEAREKGWVHTGQYTEKLEDLQKFGIATKTQLLNNVTFENIDMNHIPLHVMKEEFDFCWSACALEHLGSIENGLDFMINTLECIKPGGIAVHTTELNISSNDKTIESGPTVLFRIKDFERLQTKVRDMGHEIQLQFDFGNSRQDDFYDIPPYSEFNHIKLLLDGYVTTSFGILIKKKKN
jgi:hypothetical protein